MKKHSLYSFFNKDHNKKGDKLPKNRFYAYFDVVANRFTSLIGLSLLTSLFFIPLLAFVFIWGLYVTYETKDLSGLTALEANYKIFSLKAMEALISLPLMIIAIIGLGGTFYVTKKLVFQEPDIFLGKDFMFGIKDNIKSSLSSGIIFSLSTCGFICNIYFVPCMIDIPLVWRIIFVIVLSLVYLFLVFLSLYLLSSGTIYNFKFKDTFKNNAMLAIILYPLNLVFTIVALIFFIIYLIPIVLVQAIALVLIVFYGLAHLPLVINLYAFSKFDRYINGPKNLEILNQGLDKSQEEK